MDRGQLRKTRNLARHVIAGTSLLALAGLAGYGITSSLWPDAAHHARLAIVDQKKPLPTILGDTGKGSQSLMRQTLLGKAPEGVQARATIMARKNRHRCGPVA